MTPLEQRRFELHAQTDDYQRRVEQACDWISTAFSRYDRPYVSVSGGKDSTVLHHLVTQACGYRNADIFHFDQGHLALPGARDQVEILIEEYGGTNCIRTTEAMYDETMSNEERHKHLHSGRHGWIHRLSEQRGWEVALLGIRAEEAPSRRDRWSGDPPTHVMHGQLTMAPLYNLTAGDIWAYLVENEIEYHDQYDEQGDLLGRIDHQNNRLSSFHSPGLDRFGERTVSQFLYPEESNELERMERVAAESGGADDA